MGQKNRKFISIYTSSNLWNPKTVFKLHQLRWLIEKFKNFELIILIKKRMFYLHFQTNKSTFYTTKMLKDPGKIYKKLLPINLNGVFQLSTKICTTSDRLMTWRTQAQRCCSMFCDIVAQRLEYFWISVKALKQLLK